MDSAGTKGGYEQDSECNTFASLQTNELALLRACPEILDHQTRIYRLLRSLFGGTGVAAHSMSASSSQSSPRSALPPPHGSSSTGENTAHNPRKDQRGSGSADRNRRPELGDVITVENVRRALGVDPGNSFGIWEMPLIDESECLGFAVYPIASFFNHRRWIPYMTLRRWLTWACQTARPTCVKCGTAGR